MGLCPTCPWEHRQDQSWRGPSSCRSPAWAALPPVSPSPPPPQRLLSPFQPTEAARDSAWIMVLLFFCLYLISSQIQALNDWNPIPGRGKVRWFWTETWAKSLASPYGGWGIGSHLLLRQQYLYLIRLMERWSETIHVRVLVISLFPQHLISCHPSQYSV